MKLQSAVISTFFSAENLVSQNAKMYCGSEKWLAQISPANKQLLQVLGPKAREFDLGAEVVDFAWLLLSDFDEGCLALAAVSADSSIFVFSVEGFGDCEMCTPVPFTAVVFHSLSTPYRLFEIGNNLGSDSSNFWKIPLPTDFSINSLNRLESCSGNRLVLSTTKNDYFLLEVGLNFVDVVNVMHFEDTSAPTHSLVLSDSLFTLSGNNVKITRLTTGMSVAHAKLAPSVTFADESDQ